MHSLFLIFGYIRLHSDFRLRCRLAVSHRCMAGKGGIRQVCREKRKQCSMVVVDSETGRVTSSVTVNCRLRVTVSLIVGLPVCLRISLCASFAYVTGSALL